MKQLIEVRGRRTAQRDRTESGSRAGAGGRFRDDGEPAGQWNPDAAQRSGPAGPAHDLSPGRAPSRILRLDSPSTDRPRPARHRRRRNNRPAREFVVIFPAAANRDPAVFPDPHRFDVQRPNAGRHPAFSGGRHFCLGAALARMEGEIGLRRFFTRFPDAQLAGGAAAAIPESLRGGLACRCVWASRRPSRVSAGPRDPLTEPVAGMPRRHRTPRWPSPMAGDLEPGHEA